MPKIKTNRAARILDLSEKGVRDLADRGALPISEITEEGTRLFDREVVERVAAERSRRRHELMESA